MRRGRKLLSARRLDDVPASVRIGSLNDAPDRLVYRLARNGLLHPQTNLGVIYRVAFADRMEAGEVPTAEAPSGLQVGGMPSSLIMRFGSVIPPERFSESGRKIRASGKDLDSGLLGAWVLLTNRRVRWHYTGDGAPQIHPALYPNLGGDVRQLPYAAFRGSSNHPQINLSTIERQADIDLFVFDVGDTFYAFGFGGANAPGNLKWYEYVRTDRSEER